MIKNKSSRSAEFLLLVVAIVWGSGFIATEFAIKANMGTSLIMTIRFLVAALAIAIFSLKDLKGLDKKTLLHGSVAGIFLFLAFYSQTLGQRYTKVSNSAFLTATNVVMIPFIVWIISRKKPSTKTFVLAATTLLGIGILTLNFEQGFSFNIGDSLTLLCALFFALHISYLGLFSIGLNAKLLTLVQLSVSGIISLVILLVFDFSAITAESLQNGMLPALYLALFSTCLCYFLQTKAQQDIAPGKVGIILCTEGLFGSLFSIALGLEPLKATIIVGGIIILTSVVLMETNISFKKKKS